MLLDLDRGCYTFELAGVLPALDEATAIAAYRILQEALTNVSKHARATHCRVALGPLGNAAGIRLCIADDGEGFEAGSNGSGLGLVGMRERLAALDGRLRITAGPGQGTILDVEIPVVGSATAAEG